MKHGCFVSAQPVYKTQLTSQGSLIIVSVGLSESFPFLVQSIYPGGKIWISILVSTLAIAVIGEILPQYIIPRRSVAWGYKCRFFIWFCMGFTAIISLPLAWCLDRICGPKDALELFTNEELAGLIRHHEKSEKQGGSVGQDASRVMLGALKLDTRKVGGEIAAIPEPQDKEQDIEKADLKVVEGMIVKWSAVKTVYMDDRVDEAFIKKIRSWSYSRIPVIGTTGKERKHHRSDACNWSEDTRIYGFFHIKVHMFPLLFQLTDIVQSLIGLDVRFPENPETPFLVKDLPLYPLPIVKEDMSVYELLNMFQTGMSRFVSRIPAKGCQLMQPGWPSSCQRAF
jgi:metal transporter CNNM